MALINRSHSQVEKKFGREGSGGLLSTESQPSFPSIEVSEILRYRHERPYENTSFLTDLYLNKGWSLRRISEELGCSKTTVRKKLLRAGVELVQAKNTHETLRRKVAELREKGRSYQEIAEVFNLWRIPTRSGEGEWHGKTVREIM